MKQFFITVVACIVMMQAQAQRVDTLSIPIDGVSIFSVLTQPQPKGDYPLAIIIAGSGPTDHNGNQMTLKCNAYQYLSDALVAQQIATLRFDKRGIANSAYPGFTEAGLTFDRFASDVEAIIDHMKAKGFTKIVVIGHSEGSMLGLIAVQKKQVAGFVSLAGAGTPCDEVLKKQLAPQLPPALLTKSTQIIDSLKNDFQVKDVPVELYPLFRPSIQPYMISWFNYSPAALIAKLSIPTLIVHGEKDIQVEVSDAQKLADAAKNDKLVIIKNMNHVLKTIDGDIQANYASYSNPALPINEELAKAVTDFIKTNTK